MKCSTKSATRKQRTRKRKRVPREPSAERPTATATAALAVCPSCGATVAAEYSARGECDTCAYRWCANPKCHAPIDPTSGARCAKCGRVQFGNQYTLVHGGYAGGVRRDTPEDVQATRAAVHDFRERLVADQGGRDALTAIHDGYITRLCEAESLCRLIGRDLAQRGCFTPRGRMRGTFAAFISAVTVWDRIGQRLGMARRQRDIGDVSIEEYSRLMELREERDNDSNDRERVDVRDEDRDPDRGHSTEGTGSEVHTRDRTAE
jgi:hypothetical protein